MHPPTLRVTQRFGAALLTTTEGRTAIASCEMSETEIRFPIVAWCDTYEEALTLVQIAAEYPDCSTEDLTAITKG
jgi:hypothetical protein